MTRGLGIALALCLILQSISGVLLQDPSEFGGGGNDAFSDEYITQVPTVGENDVALEAVDDLPADGSLADGSMVPSGLEDSQTTISVPTLGDNEGEEPADSSDADSFVTLSPDDSLDSTAQEDASENLPHTIDPSWLREDGSHTIDPSWLRQDGSLSMYNDSSDASVAPESNNTDADSTDIASAEANSTDVTYTDNGTVITSAEANSTDITDTTDTDGANSTSTDTNSTAIFNTDTNSTEFTSTDANGTEAITPSSESNSSNVTNPLTPGPTNPPGVNDTMGGLNPVTENPTESETTENVPEPTAEYIPDATAENTPMPTAEDTPEPTAEDIPSPTTESIPEPTAEDIPDDTTTPSADATALAKAAAAGNADQGERPALFSHVICAAHCLQGHQSQSFL